MIERTQRWLGRDIERERPRYGTYLNVNALEQLVVAVVFLAVGGGGLRSGIGGANLALVTRQREVRCKERKGAIQGGGGCGKLTLNSNLPSGVRFTSGLTRSWMSIVMNTRSGRMANLMVGCRGIFLGYVVAQKSSTPPVLSAF